MKKYSTSYPLIFGIIFLMIGIYARQIAIMLLFGLVPIIISVLLKWSDYKEKKNGKEKSTQLTNRIYQEQNNKSSTLQLIQEKQKENDIDAYMPSNTKQILIGEPIKLLTKFLKNKNYDIEFSTDTMTIVKHSDDPWNSYMTFIAKSDGVYNFIERTMGSYELTKRLSCSNYEIASFVLLTVFFAKVLSLEKDADTNIQTILDSIKEHIDYALKNTSNYYRGQWFIDEILEIIK